MPAAPGRNLLVDLKDPQTVSHQHGIQYFQAFFRALFSLLIYTDTAASCRQNHLRTQSFDPSENLDLQP